jgi:hypothetical protein
MLAKHLKALGLIAEDGNTYNLYSGQNPADLIALDGAGMATVRRITQRTPLQQGVTDRGFRLEPRRMTLALYINQPDELMADQMRDKLAYIFSPTISPLKLLATRLDNTQRQIDCYVDGTLDFPQSERLGPSQKVICRYFAQIPLGTIQRKSVVRRVCLRYPHQRLHFQPAASRRMTGPCLR